MQLVKSSVYRVFSLWHCCSRAFSSQALVTKACVDQKPCEDNRNCLGENSISSYFHSGWGQRQFPLPLFRKQSSFPISPSFSQTPTVAGQPVKGSRLQRGDALMETGDEGLKVSSQHLLPHLFLHSYLPIFYRMSVQQEVARDRPAKTLPGCSSAGRSVSPARSPGAPPAQQGLTLVGLRFLGLSWHPCTQPSSVLGGICPSWRQT